MNKIRKKEDSDIQGFSDNRLIKQNKKTRESILKLQATIANMDGCLSGKEAEKVLTLTHHFAPGCYAREIFLPANHTIIGKIHNHAHLNIIQKGRVSVSTEDGSKELEAPCVFTSYAGTKRAVYAHEDTIWITIHVTEKTDLAEIEDEIIAKDFEEFDEEIKMLNGEIK